jgi:hypothetical protein
MPKHSAHLSYDGATGEESIFHRYHDGTWAVETRADISDVLDANKEQQNHGARPGALQPQWGRHVARIPPLIVVKWLNEYGINIYDPAHEKAMIRKLNDSEWRWLKTTDEVI